MATPNPSRVGVVPIVSGPAQNSREAFIAAYSNNELSQEDKNRTLGSIWQKLTEEDKTFLNESYKENFEERLASGGRRKRRSKGRKTVKKAKKGGRRTRGRKTYKGCW